MASPAGWDSFFPVAGLFQTRSDECSALTAVTLIPGKGVTWPDLLKRCVRLAGSTPRVTSGVIMSAGPYRTVLFSLAIAGASPR